jgi:pilus assembly protein Flp/PilA
MEKDETGSVLMVHRSAKATRNLRRFLHDDRGATAVEYALIASGIAVAIAATIVSLGTSVNGLYTSVATAMK